MNGQSLGAGRRAEKAAVSSHGPVIGPRAQRHLPQNDDLRQPRPRARQACSKSGRGTTPQVHSDHREPRVLIVEDHEAIARGLGLLLRREGIEIAGTAASVPEAERLLERRAADLVVLDISLHGDDGLRLVPAAKARGQRVLLYTGTTDPGTIAAALAAGADGVASKTGSPASFLAAVRAVADGESYLDPDLPSAEPPPEGDHPRLTPRECEIVALLARGLSGEDIALELFLSPATVRTHLRNAMDRTGAKTRSQLVAMAAASGQISID